MANTFRPRRWWLCLTCRHIKKSARWGKGCPKCGYWPSKNLGQGSMTKKEARAVAADIVTKPS